jgi:hypothetical protein
LIRNYTGSLHLLAGQFPGQAVFELKGMPVMEETFARGQRRVIGETNSSPAICLWEVESKTGSLIDCATWLHRGIDLQRAIWIVFAKIRSSSSILLQQQRSDMAYWQTVRDFWAAYFKRTGANLKSYSVLRDLTDLAR